MPEQMHGDSVGPAAVHRPHPIKQGKMYSPVLTATIRYTEYSKPFPGVNSAINVKHGQYSARQNITNKAYSTPLSFLQKMNGSSVPP